MDSRSSSERRQTFFGSTPTGDGDIARNLMSRLRKTNRGYRSLRIYEIESSIQTEDRNIVSNRDESRILWMNDDFRDLNNNLQVSFELNMTSFKFSALQYQGKEKGD